MTTRTRAPKTAPVKKAESITVAERARDTVRKMSPEQLQELLDGSTEFLNSAAPSMAAAGSDLFMLLLVVGRLFVEKYYPTATRATFHVSRASKDTDAPGFAAMLPMYARDEEPK